MFLFLLQDRSSISSVSTIEGEGQAKQSEAGRFINMSGLFGGEKGEQSFVSFAQMIYYICF